MQCIVQVLRLTCIPTFESYCKYKCNTAIFHFLFLILHTRQTTCTVHHMELTEQQLMTTVRVNSNISCKAGDSFLLSLLAWWVYIYTYVASLISAFAQELKGQPSLLELLALLAIPHRSHTVSYNSQASTLHTLWRKHCFVQRPTSYTITQCFTEHMLTVLITIVIRALCIGYNINAMCTLPNALYEQNIAGKKHSWRWTCVHKDFWYQSKNLVKLPELLFCLNVWHICVSTNRRQSYRGFSHAQYMFK